MLTTGLSLLESNSREGRNYEGREESLRKPAEEKRNCSKTYLTSCRPEPSSRRYVNKEAYGLSSVHLKIINIQYYKMH